MKVILASGGFVFGPILRSKWSLQLGNGFVSGSVMGPTSHSGVILAPVSHNGVILRPVAHSGTIYGPVTHSGYVFAA